MSNDTDKYAPSSLGLILETLQSVSNNHILECPFTIVLISDEFDSSSETVSVSSCVETGTTVYQVRPKGSANSQTVVMVTSSAEFRLENKNGRLTLIPYLAKKCPAKCILFFLTSAAYTCIPCADQEGERGGPGPPP